MKLSVLICTRNRARSLDEALARIFAQPLRGDYLYEVLVVDNGSTDETKAIVDLYLTRHPEIVRFCREPQPGLSRARNRGIVEANGEIIVFTDDDVLVSSDWLDQIHREFTNNPELMMLGGKVLPARPELQDISLQPCDERLIFTFPDNGNFAIGANMAFRRELFDLIGLFDPRLGAGQFFAGADEADLFYRALRSGHQLLYAPNVLVYHNHDRVTAEHVRRLEYSYGKGGAAYLVKHALHGDRYAMRMVYWAIRKLPQNWARRKDETKEMTLRRRAHIRGLMVGFLTAPWVMRATAVEEALRQKGDKAKGKYQKLKVKRAASTIK